MNNLTRRDWLLAAACWGDLLRAQTAEPHFAYLDPESAAEIEAIAEAILPSDRTPGARTAGVIWFIDRALAGHDADKREIYREGLSRTQKKRREMFPGSISIAALNAAQQVQLLKAVEQTEFFLLLRQHTILGFFGHPKHGGNRENASAKLLGIDEAMHFAPPFGYYDREAVK